MSRFIIVDGKVEEKKEINISELILLNYKRVFRKMWFGYGGIPLFHENINSLINEIDFLQIPKPKILTDKKELFRIIKRMLNKNRFYRSGYVYLNLFWEKDSVRILITCEALNEFEFPFHEKGILVNFSDIKKTDNKELTDYLFPHISFWESLSARLKNSAYTNSIIFNKNQSICECINSNIFLVSGKEIITPSLNAGCYNNILRNHILEIGRRLNYFIVESDKIQRNSLFQMDEIFIASEENGIQWILGIENKRYIYSLSRTINAELNLILNDKVF